MIYRTVFIVGVVVICQFGLSDGKKWRYSQPMATAKSLGHPWKNLKG
jgi:hypothetical protein